MGFFDDYILRNALDTFFGTQAIQIIIAVVIGVLAYVLQCYIWNCIGVKCSLTSNWMPYVPFARDVYKLNMVGEKKWKIIFFGDITGVVFVFLLVMAFVTLSFTVCAIFGVLYLIIVYYVYVSWLWKLYEKFNYNSAISLAVLISPIINLVLNVNIAFDNRVQCGSAAVSSRAMTAPTVKGGSITGVSGYYRNATIDMESGTDYFIGKDPSQCNIVITQDGAEHVSRKHCKISYNSSTRSYTVTDYSKNGTTTNGNLTLPSNVPTNLKPGTIIYLGDKNNGFKLD